LKHTASLCRHAIVDEGLLHRAYIRRNPSLFSSHEARRRLRIPHEHSAFLSVNLFNSEGVFPYLTASLVKTCILLYTKENGFSSCFISIYESGSVDKTKILLKKFESELRKWKIPHSVVLGDAVRRAGEHRISFLARVRNLAMEPLYSSTSGWDDVIFFNDVITCASGIAELLLHKQQQGADFASSFDYNDHPELGLVFYDIWVAKDIRGESFNNQVPYINHEPSWRAFQEMQPFQVFSNWGGLVAISSKVFLHHQLKFRHSGLLECAVCEAELIQRDMWDVMGIEGAKIIAVPTVFVGYDIAGFKKALSMLDRDYELFSKTGRFNSPLAYANVPPITIHCCGMEFEDLQIMDLDSLCYNTPWQWWYDAVLRSDQFFSSHNSLTRILQSATASLRRVRRAGNFCEGIKDGIPEIFHFALPSDQANTVPHLLVMQVLELSRLHPCHSFDFHIVDYNSPMFDPQTVLLNVVPRKSSAAWLTLLDSLYQHGGIAVLGVPWRPRRELSDIFYDKKFVAVRNRDSSGINEEPIMIGAVKRDPVVLKILRQIRGIDPVHALSKRLRHETVDKLPHSYVADILFSLTSGLSNLLGLSHQHLRWVDLSTDSIAQHDFIGYPSSTHHYADRLMVNEILQDGDFIVGTSAIGGKVDYILTLRSAKRDGSAQGCLRIARKNMFHVSSSETWKSCWSRESELDITYAVNVEGVLRIFTSLKHCSLHGVDPDGSTRQINLKYSFDTIPGDGNYISISYSGKLRLGDKKAKGKNSGIPVGKLNGQLSVKNRCIASGFIQKWCTDYFNHTYFQMMGYRDGCKTIS